MTKIEWTEKTWNPIVGCSIVSPGCTNCYAMKMAARLEAMARVHAANRADATLELGPLSHYLYTTQTSKAGPVWTGKVALAPERILTEPLRRNKPTTYFVNSMGDLFHEDVPDEWIDRVFAVMALSPQHTFQVLTKRAARMRAYLNLRTDNRADLIGQCIRDIACSASESGVRDYPLPNVWLGVSAERQQEADERIPDLLATAAAVRFVSAEPLLGPIDFRSVSSPGRSAIINTLDWRDALIPITYSTIDWVIVGGESGHGARPMHPDWARSIRDQCQAAGVPFFFKQWGAWEPTGLLPQHRSISTTETIALKPDGTPAYGPQYLGGTSMDRVGKVRAGRLLDGREHNDMPGREVRT